MKAYRAQVVQVKEEAGEHSQHTTQIESVIEDLTSVFPFGKGS